MFLRVLFASLSARRLRVILALLAVSLGVAVATALATLSLQVGDDLARTLRAAGPNFLVQPAGAVWPLDLGGAEFQPARAGASLPPSSVAALRRAFWRNALLAAAPELTVGANLDGVSATLVGTWFERPVVGDDGTWTTGLRRLRPTWRITGRWPREDSSEVALGRDLARRLGARPGSRVTAAVGGRARSLEVTGILDAGGRDDERAWAPLAPVQALGDRTGEIDRIWVSALVRAGGGPEPDPVKDPTGYERYMCTPYPVVVARDLAEQVEGAEVLPLAEAVAGESQVVGRLNLLLLLLALAALAAATLGLVSTTTATVVERRAEIGLLRSIGASTQQVAALLLGETALVSVAGGVLGWALGSFAAAAVRGHTFGQGGTLVPLLLPVALGLGLAVALLGTLGPLRMALRIDPAVVLRGQQ